MIILPPSSPLSLSFNHTHHIFSTLHSRIMILFCYHYSHSFSHIIFVLWKFVLSIWWLIWYVYFLVLIHFFFFLWCKITQSLPSSSTSFFLYSFFFFYINVFFLVIAHNLTSFLLTHHNPTHHFHSHLSKECIKKQPKRMME